MARNNPDPQAGAGERDGGGIAGTVVVAVLIVLFLVAMGALLFLTLHK